MLERQFTQTDPMPYGPRHAYESAYVYAGDNPAVYMDPSGLRKKLNIAGIEEAVREVKQACHGETPQASEPRLGGKLDAVEFCAVAVGVAGAREVSGNDSDITFNLDFLGYERWLSPVFSNGTRHPAQYRTPHSLHIEVTRDHQPSCSSPTPKEVEKTAEYQREGGGPCRPRSIVTAGLGGAGDAEVAVVSGVAAWEKGSWNETGCTFLGREHCNWEGKRGWWEMHPAFSVVRVKAEK